MQARCRKPGFTQRGFTLIEMMVAILVIAIGLVAVAQLVPASIRLNSVNRDDSTALVLAQNELNQFIQQPLTNFAYTDPAANPCNGCALGTAGVTGAWVGTPLIPFNNRLVINFGAGTVPGFNFTWGDPNDPSGVQYDVRWAVYTFANGAGKRFIIGVRRSGGNAPLLPVSLDTMVEK